MIEALKYTPYNDLSSNFEKILTYLSYGLNARVVDPANTYNIISDELSINEKRAIQNVASDSLTTFSSTRSWYDVFK